MVGSRSAMVKLDWTHAAMFVHVVVVTNAGVAPFSHAHLLRSGFVSSRDR